MAESDIFYVKRGADDDGAIEKLLWLLVVELWAFLSPKFGLQNGLEKVLFTATIGMPLRTNGDCDVIESYLEWKPQQALQGKRLSSRNFAAYVT